MFVLVAFDDLHPLGGVADVVGVYPSVEAAKQAASQPWGERTPDSYDVCEIHQVDGDEFVFAAEWTGVRWVEP